MRELKERLELAGVVLRELSREPLSHTILEKKVRNRGGATYATFEGIFRFLIDDGDIEKCGVELRAPFRITERGKAFLAWRASGE